MVLSDIDIIERVGNGDLTIAPYEEENVEPSSVDLRLGEEFKKVEHRDGFGIVDTNISNNAALEYTDINGQVVIEPSEFVLATTQEYVEIPDDLVAEVLGRSSLGRLGISVHQTAGFIDPGFEGEITLELSNHGPAPIRLYAGQRVCQIVFSELSSEAITPYGHKGSQYQHQRGATGSSMGFD